MIYLILGLFLIQAIAKHYRDEIAHHSYNSLFPNWGWYNENRWQTKSWWLKNPFSFFLDGWHFLESTIGFVMSTYASLLIYALYDIPIWGVIAMSIFLYALGGSLHNWVLPFIQKLLKK